MLKNANIKLCLKISNENKISQFFDCYEINKNFYNNNLKFINNKF